ncbi:unannotated protein [freshwater metagenome]
MYAAQGQLLESHTNLVGELIPGGAAAIASAEDESNPAAENSLDRAAMEAGTD